MQFNQTIVIERYKYGILSCHFGNNNMLNASFRFYIQEQYIAYNNNNKIHYIVFNAYIYIYIYIYIDIYIV